ncbi:MAG: glycosyltransferase family 9 protein, partial [Candidatus Woesearchaeota archaeon]
KRIGFSKQFRSRLYNNNESPFTRTRHIVELYMDLGKILGISQQVSRLEELPVSKQNKKIVDEYFRKNKLTGKKIVMLAPGVGASGRQRIWPVGNYAKLADRLIKNDLIVMFIGSPFDRADIESIISLMKLKKKAYYDPNMFPLKQFFYACTKAAVFVSNDTGPMHVAAAQGVRTLGLFGPNIPARWRPYGKGNDFIYHKLECSPCIINEKGAIQKCCNKEYQKCMKLISVDEVYEKILKMI